jgi:hypothetical protein
MNPIATPFALRVAAPARRWAPAGAAAVLAACGLLAACGGGGGAPSSPSSPPPVSGPASVLVAGPITGFGSVIVDGMRLDDDQAAITDDDGRALAESELRLGMQCDVSGDDHGGGRGSAHEIHVHAALVGAVQSVDAAAGTLTVLDQTVASGPQTAIDDSITGGLAGIAAGDVLEIHAQFDAAGGVYRATRIGRHDGAGEFRLRGTVTALDAAAGTLAIGAARIDFHAASAVPTGLAVGSVVLARLQPAPVAGAWVAARIDDGRRARDDHDEARLRGTVTAFASATQFSVDGTPVDAGAASLDVGAGALALGASVEVEGRIRGGVLMADKVSVEDERRGGDDALGGAIELHGTVSALDPVAQAFTVRGTRVSYAGSVQFEDGSAATLAQGLFVEVHGDLSADGTVVEASRIDLHPES